MSNQQSFKHVKYLWKDEEAEQLKGVDRLVYRSNRLGDDLTLTNTGGGNTSSKLMEKDPLTGAEVEVLWIKGSGGDLRTAKRDGFASLYLDKVRAMKPRYLSDPERGPKTPIEDEMYPMYNHCVFNLNPRACSIDTAGGPSSGRQPTTRTAAAKPLRRRTIGCMWQKRGAQGSRTPAPASRGDAGRWPSNHPVGGNPIMKAVRNENGAGTRVPAPFRVADGGVRLTCRGRAAADPRSPPSPGPGT